MWVTSIAQRWSLALALETMPWTLGRGVTERWCTEPPFELEQPVDPFAVHHDTVLAQPGGELSIAVRWVGLDQKADPLDKRRIKG
jgi:hypothetical protein